MAAAAYNFVLEQGATYREDFVWQETETGPVIPLTGYTARMQLRQTISSPTVLIELTTSNGGITIDGPAGKVTVYMSAEDTASLSFTTAVYDLELVSSSGVVIRWLKGTITLDPEVTR